MKYTNKELVRAAKKLVAALNPVYQRYAFDVREDGSVWLVAFYVSHDSDVEQSTSTCLQRAGSAEPPPAVSLSDSGVD